MDDHELQEQYEYLSEKVSRLRKALAIETDIPNKFKALLGLRGLMYNEAQR